MRTSIEGIERLLDRGVPASDLFACIAWPVDQRVEVLTERGFLRRARPSEEDEESASVLRALQSILLLQSHLERRGVAYVMGCTDPLRGLPGDPRRSAPERFAYLARAIRWDQFLWDRDRPLSLQSWAFRTGHLTTPNGLWPEEAHGDFAERVLQPWFERHAPNWRGRSSARFSEGRMS